MKDTLQSALAFYRDNRELITMLAGAQNPLKEKDAPKQEASKQEQSRPQATLNDKILEEFLKSASL